MKLSSTRAKKGSTVTITVTLDEGYQLDELVVLDDEPVADEKEEKTLVLTIGQAIYQLNGE